jgi:hypothetical protein
VNKALLYGALGLLYHGIVTLNDVKTDCRVNAIYILPSGRGKKHIRNLKYKTNERFRKIFSEPSSFHPEQYIGKKVWRKLRNDDLVTADMITRGKKKDKPEEILDEAEGYLRDDEHFIEEGNPLLRGDIKENRQTFATICKSTDMIGVNRISKKLVDQKRDEGLAFCPETQVNICIQPFQINPELVLNGLFRRFVCVYPRIPEHVSSEDLRARSGNRIMNPEAEKMFFNRLVSIKEWLGEEPHKKQIRFASENKELFDSMVDEILSFARYHSPNAKKYSSMLAYDCQNQLLKLAALQAVYHKKNVIEEKELRFAYIDLFEFSESAFRYLDKKIDGTLDYNLDYKQSKKKRDEKDFLTWLWLELADDKETTQTTIEDALCFLNREKELQERTAQRFLKRLQISGIIDKVTAPGTSKIWLSRKFKPELIELSQFDFQKSIYLKCLTPVSPDSSESKPDKTDDTGDSTTED